MVQFTNMTGYNEYDRTRARVFVCERERERMRERERESGFCWGRLRVNKRRIEVIGMPNRE